MPTTAPDIVVALAGSPVSFDVLANDTGSGLTLESWTQPAHGTLVHTGGGTFTYTADSGFAGVDGFTYTVRDAGGATATGTVTISVLAPNADPVAADDTAETTTGTPVDIPVLANDADPDGDPLRITGIGIPAHGTVTLRPGQAIRYVPQAGFTGIDRFVYTVDDGRGGLAQATVTVRVGAADRAPRARDDAYTVESGSTAVLDPLANDEDPDGDPLRLVGLEVPAHGRVTVVGGRVHYTPDPGFEGEDGFTYTVGDGRGGLASARVRLTVRRPNAAPTARADAVTTVENTPVVVAPLANDDDPDGDPLRLTALELPAHGSLALAADGTLTYTPDPGFTGEDAFGYTVSDGRGGIATATVTVTVQPASALEPRFPNGYARRRRILLPPQEVDETLTDFRLLVRFEDPTLRSVAHGGSVESDQGFDIRFEAEDGTSLAHDLLDYDPASGRLAAFVRLPSWRTGIQTRLHLYYGKPGLAASESDPAATWQGELAVWNPADGVDRTGQGRDLIPNAVTADMWNGLPVAAFDGGTAHADLADASFLAGHATLCLRFFMIPDTVMVGSDRFVLVQGTVDPSSRRAGLVFRFDDAGGERNGDDAWFFTLRTDSGEIAWYQSASYVHRAGVPQLIHACWRSGAHPRIWRNGKPVTAAWVGRWSGSDGMQERVAAGVLAPVAGSGLSIGIGTLSPPHAFAGRLGTIRLSPSWPSDVEIRMEARAYFEPWRLWALGPEETADMHDFPPVAADLDLVTETGRRMEVDLSARTFDPEGTVLVPVAVTPPLHGTTTIAGGRIRYVPRTGYVGPDSFEYTVADSAGHTASARAHVTVRRVGSGTMPEYPPPLRELVVRDRQELARALAGARPGDHVILEDGDYSGLYEMRASGTPDAPIVIRARNVLGARIGTRGIVFPDSSTHDVVVWGIDFKDCLWMPLNGQRIIFRRCRIWPLYSRNGAIGIKLENCSDIRIDYCTLRMYTVQELISMGIQTGNNGSYWENASNYGCIWSYSRGKDFLSGSYPRNVIVERCRFEGGPSGVPYGSPNCQFVEFGGYPGATHAWDWTENRPKYPMNNIIRLCYGHVDRDRTIIDIKGSDCTLDRIHIVADRGSIQIRSGVAHRILRCRFEGPYMSVQSKGHLVANVAGTVRIMAGDITWDWDFTRPGSTSRWAACVDTRIYNCPGTVVIGDWWSGRGTPPFQASNIVYANCPNAAILHATNVKRMDPTPYSVEDPVILSAAEVGHDAPWVGIES